jgi:hypothetical protein
MKYFTHSILLLLAIFVSTFSVAQNKSVDQFVEDFLGPSRYQSYLIDNPGLIEYLKIKSVEGYKIKTVEEHKFLSYKELPKVLFEKEEISTNEFLRDLQKPDFNFLNYYFPGTEEGAFRLSSVDKTIIIIYSNEYVNSKLRNK